MPERISNSLTQTWQQECALSTEEISQSQTSTSQERRKPYLTPPTFTFGTKIWDDNYLLHLESLIHRTIDDCYGIEKDENKILGERIKKTQEKQRDDEAIALAKKNEAGKWGVAIHVFSWITSLVSVITGITLIATGVGVVAGVLMLVGGLIQIGSQIMEITGGWEKILEILPGNDEQKKRAMLSWIQIGITIFCMIMAAAGVIMGGFSTIGENMQKATALMGAIALLGNGVTAIGQGIVTSEHKKKQGDLKRHEVKLQRMEERRKDLMENQESLIPLMRQLFEMMGRIVEMNEHFTDRLCGRR